MTQTLAYKPSYRNHNVSLETFDKIRTIQRRLAWPFPLHICPGNTLFRPSRLLLPRINVQNPLAHSHTTPWPLFLFAYMPSATLFFGQLFTLWSAYIAAPLVVPSLCTSTFLFS
ncbi:hypothetical protein SORBI_3005G187250 [Sorghum bicolor]|uniref:Uncharacterized protein n=1 Tax=Sorghum bicolor TaxID=4558 RepID=A0A1Z5RJW1_SORBI|nr:hypothetical protein SORBI_3005G187250 [Sorghum bicolor]